MFLTQEPYTIEDFLKSIGFITPPGMDVKYFIVPAKTRANNFDALAQETDFTNEHNVSGVTDTLYFSKKPDDKTSFGSAKLDVKYQPDDFPKEPNLEKPDEEADNIIKHGGKVNKNEFYKFVSSNEEFMESVSNSDYKVILKEKVGCFPKNTLVCFKESNLNA